jgi:hypothetical protein
VTIKMETPVTYFYSDRAVLVNASVDFPKGVLTQWYPRASSWLPAIAAPNSIGVDLPATYADPVLNASFPFQTEMCRARLSAVAGGRLDWGNFSVSARGDKPELPLPSAPLDQFGWSYARQVDSNLVRMPGGESEKFLFYRGLGEFDLPVKVQAGAAGQVKFSNTYREAMGSVFVLNVAQKQAAFSRHAQGIAAGGTLADTVPSLETAASLDEYEAGLASAVTDALDASGLYHDEAVAMVNTWRRQWFRTPGIRALYLIPQSWTDESIPLTIAPKPDSTLRVMLIRVELITPEQETSDVKAVGLFGSDTTSATLHFTDLGRFAEPRLRRALALSPSVAGDAFLAKIAGANANVASGE